MIYWTLVMECQSFEKLWGTSIISFLEAAVLFKYSLKIITPITLLDRQVGPRLIHFVCVSYTHWLRLEKLIVSAIRIQDGSIVSFELLTIYLFNSNYLLYTSRRIHIYCNFIVGLRVSQYCFWPSRAVGIEALIYL